MQQKKLCQGPRCSQLIPGYLEITKTEMFILRDVQLAKYILFGINTYSKEKGFFSKRAFFCISQNQHQNLIKVMHIWCSSFWFVTLSAFSEPFPKAISWNYLQHLCPCTNRWKRCWVLLLVAHRYATFLCSRWATNYIAWSAYSNVTQGITFTASKTCIRKVSDVSSEA